MKKIVILLIILFIGHFIFIEYSTKKLKPISKNNLPEVFLAIAFFNDSYSVCVLPDYSAFFSTKKENKMDKKEIDNEFNNLNKNIKILEHDKMSFARFTFDSKEILKINKKLNSKGNLYNLELIENDAENNKKQVLMLKDMTRDGIHNYYYTAYPNEIVPLGYISFTRSYFIQKSLVYLFYVIILGFIYFLFFKIRKNKMEPKESTVYE